MSNYCKYCFNARVYKPTEEELYNGDILHDDNDFSSIGIGHSATGTALYISSGNGRPVCMEVLQWNEKHQMNHTIAKYIPKFCPECGRNLQEDYK